MELAMTKRVTAPRKLGVMSPRVRFEAIQVMRSEGLATRGCYAGWTMEPAFLS